MSDGSEPIADYEILYRRIPEMRDDREIVEIALHWDGEVAACIISNHAGFARKIDTPEERLSVDIPPFRADGYLPEGIHPCTEAELTFRFGTQSRRRQRLILRLRRWIELGRAVGALRLLVDGSFVTAKPDPDDVDAAILVPADFSEQVAQGVGAALELEEMFLTRQPEELFPAESEAVWQGWCEFFSRTREPDRCRKGIVEVVL